MNWLPQALPQPAAIDWTPFLARPQLPAPTTETLAQLKEASILVTGAGGSIGSALSLALAALEPRQLVLLESSEQALYRLETRLPKSTGITTILGSFTDETLLEETLSAYQPTLLFHAAAHKHIALLESHPLAAIANNAVGTHSLASLAHQHGVQRIVLLSTDKVVEPTSILGATKRIAEDIVLAHNGVVLRLSNVLGSEGSVVDTFLQQIATGSPVTLAHPDADRYFVALEESVDLLLNAAVLALPATLLVPQLDQPHPISALAEFLQSTRITKSPITFTGLRPGDKLHEKLWANDERATSSTTPGCLELQPTTRNPHPLNEHLLRLRAALEQRSLPAALEAIALLVPNYTPSPTLLQQAHSSIRGVPQP